MKTQKTIQKALLICSISLCFAALTNAQLKVIYYWDFNSKAGGGNVGGDSLGTAFSYANTLHVDSMNKTLPLWANYSRPGANKARILYTRPSTNGVLVNETSTGQEGGTPTPCDDSVLVGSSYYHGIKYNGNLYPELSWVNDLPLLGNDSGTGKAVPYLGSSQADEDIEEAGNLFIKANNPATGSFMTFYMPTTGYINVVFNFALSTSSTGNIPYNTLSYTTDGATWKKLTTAMDTFNLSGKPTPDTILVTNYELGNSFWELRTLNFTSDPSVNNNPNFAIRIGYPGPSIGSHNTRYDNFSLSGDSTNTLGVNQIISANNIKVYPNPNKGQFTVSLQGNTEQSMIEVFNMLGEKVYTTKLNSSTTTIDLGSNPVGIYLYRVITETGSNLIGEGKLVIQK